jgi:excinuclease UvrABC nuclease subunit
MDGRLEPARGFSPAPGLKLGLLAPSDLVERSGIPDVPDLPAVFLAHFEGGRPYLARTGFLRRRLKRMANRLPSLSHVEYWRTASRLESSLLLYHLAVRDFPDTYLELLKLRMPPYIKLLLGNPYPRTQVTTKLGGPSLYYGPFRTRAAAELFESQLLEFFQIRRCVEDLQPSPEHPGCMYGEMNMCLRPCQLAVGVEEYGTEVRRVIEFLDTRGRSLIEPLSAARERLSEEMNFEEAARTHKRIENIEQMERTQDELAADVERLHGVAITPSVAQGAVELWFIARGAWLPGVRFGFDSAGASIDHRLREVVATLAPPRAGIKEKQEHLALLARWFYSTWRDGEWLQFRSFEEAPYRKLVRAISKVLKSQAV